jgi:tripartite-type tricarboxylate transporter receptor subunit TctC
MKIEMFRRKHGPENHSHGRGVGIFAFLLIGSFALLALPENGGAKEWPAKAITIIVPWAPGASTDMTPRTLAPKLSTILGVPIQVVNKAGGSGIIGTLEAVKSPPDGYTLLADCGGTSSIQEAWSANLPYKVEERTYIARAICAPLVLIVPASSSWQTVDDLVNAIRSNPSGISFGVIGGTGVPDVAIAQFRAATTAKGVDNSKTRAVTYKGSGEVGPAIGGGHISYSFTTPSACQALVSAGKIRALAMTSAQRYKNLPHVPTTVEIGFPSVDMVYWAGFAGPPGLPENIVKTVDNAVKESLRDPEVIAKLAKIGLDPFYLPGDQFRKFVFDEVRSIKSLKIR